MFNISKQQALQRWEVLPDSLREALFSEYNADALWKICQDQHLPEDRIKKVALLLGDVILGFEHFDDLAKDIVLETGINQQIANSIVQEIDRKILPPIKVDVKKNYKPAVPESLATRPVVVGIRPAGSSSFTKASEDKAKQFSPLDILKEAPLMPKPKVEIPISASMPIIPPPPPLPAVASAKEGVVPAPSSAEGPLIIHKETEFKPLSENKKSLGGFFNFLNKGAEKKEIKDVVSPVRAKVEIGPETFGVKKEMEKKFTPSRPLMPEHSDGGQAKVKIVHYSDIPSSVSANPFSSIPSKPAEFKDSAFPSSAPIMPKMPENAPKPTLRDLSKPILPIEPKPSFSPKPPVPPVILERDLSAQPVSRPTVIPVPGQPVKLTPPAPPVQKAEEDKPKENVIDLRSFK
jgi:hypothetical protein